MGGPSQEPLFIAALSASNEHVVTILQHNSKKVIASVMQNMDLFDAGNNHIGQLTQMGGQTRRLKNAKGVTLLTVIPKQVRSREMSFYATPSGAPREIARVTRYPLTNFYEILIASDIDAVIIFLCFFGLSTFTKQVTEEFVLGS